MNTNFAILDVRQMAEADRLTIAAGTPGAELMENAGKAVADEIRRRWTARPVMVLCGPGNNGGDGFVVARLLSDSGWPVRVALLGSQDRLKGDANIHAKRWRGSAEALEPASLMGAELVVDAIFGAGLSRELEGLAKETLAAAERQGLPIVAIDVPSGVKGDTGEALGAVAAVLTVTFFRKKPGHLLLPGRSLCGEIVVADIGISPTVLAQIAPNTFENDPQLWKSALPRQHDGGGKAIERPAVLVMCEGDFDRRFGSSGDRLTRTRAAAHQCGAVVVLQGSDTMIAAPDGRAVIQANTPVLTSTDSVEVLNGTVEELIAQGMEPLMAAAASVWIGTSYFVDLGHGLTAEDLRDRLPGLLKQLLEQPE